MSFALIAGCGAVNVAAHVAAHVAANLAAPIVAVQCAAPQLLSGGER
ncbi:hypothetical protein [Aeromonas cavernicola]|nr:hypothetical protein [Aeromonas cavernicola]